MHRTTEIVLILFSIFLMIKICFIEIMFTLNSDVAISLKTQQWLVCALSL